MAETTRSSAVAYVGEVREEVRKVTWPDWPQLKNSTGVIMVFSGAVAAIIFVIDLGVRGALNLIASVFGG